MRGSLLFNFCFILFLPIFLIGFKSTSTYANSFQSERFVQSLTGSVYEFDFLVEGLNSVNQISFSDDMTAQYQSFFNRIVLSRTAGDPSKRIKSIENLDEEDVGTIAHEAFHAFKANIMGTDPKFKAEKLWFKQRAHKVFSNLKASKRETALEEAYAVFLGSVVTARLQSERIIAHAPKERFCKKLNVVENLWRVNWNSKVQGYYYRDGLGEYWADKIHNLFSWLAFSRPVNSSADGAIDAEQSIDQNDKDWISTKLLEKKMVYSFYETMGLDSNSCPTNLSKHSNAT